MIRKPRRPDMELGACTTIGWPLPDISPKYLPRQRYYGFTTDERRRSPHRDEQDGSFDSTNLRISINLTPSRRNQVAFIKQEALEKAREIKVKADEEFAIEKVTCTIKRR